MSREAEQSRVNEVIGVINKKEEKLYSKSSGLKKTIISLRESFWDDVTVNLEELDDIIETQASIKQQAELLIEREQVHGNIAKELKTLRRLKDAPYFGRIDFIETPGQDKEEIYIGTASLMDKEEENFLIYDWRAPISSLYYDHAPGEAQYEIADGSISGEMTLKRQFIIRQGEIKGMFDTGLTIRDLLLQQALGNNASTTMKSIVATIQEEQNRIIRNDRSNLLIVQGVAGSGKTSAILQRIAYLLYRFRNELNTNNMLMFSPNPLFASYVANVLPELGEENIKQSTFYDFLEKRVESNMTIESPFSQMEYTLTAQQEADYPIRLRNMNYKSGLEFKSLLDTYINGLLNEGLQFRNINLHGEVLISKAEIAEYFYSLNEIASIPNRMDAVAKWLLQRLRTVQKNEKNKDWVMEKAELLDKEEYLQAYRSTQQMDEEDPKLEEEFLRREVVKRQFAGIKKRVKRFAFVNVSVSYQRLYLDWSPPQTPADWDDIRSLTAAAIRDKHLYWEDATPYVYFLGRLFSDDANRKVRHLFIDEAQDYSAFQFAYIRHISPYTKMTLLGDINQAIYAYATEDNPLVPEKSEYNHERITLNKSYRSTRQITQFTRCFAPGKTEIEAFERDGDKPKLINLGQLNRPDALVKSIHELQGKGHETIAIICKTLHESDVLYKELSEKVTIIQINEETYNFEKGLVILPVYLAKGIEFDAVIIPDASNQRYDQESDRALFYTACTRAMHDLYMISLESPCTFIEEANQETFDAISI
ncbi:RNA polymerase recycling motor HelD [Virgibacillus flavescens]|uniref:RNA polymerase recycling motor HelD n=1 Tax=Virgibacillus flavescens TaxID=1611422 RepID=UPI003D3289ED